MELETIKKMTRDLTKASATLGKDEARFLVDTYYQVQSFRIATANQVRSIVKSDVDEPHETLAFFGNQFEGLENNIKKALEYYVKNQTIGQWLLGITGIGPVIAAGLIANLDINKAETAGAFWRFCGLDPTSEWMGTAKATELVNGIVGDRRTLTLDDVAKIALECSWGCKQALAWFTPGEENQSDKTRKLTKTNVIKYFSRVPYNKNMKTLMFKIGESFIKVQNNPNDVYGKLFVERKAYESKKNSDLEYESIAKAKAEKVGKDTEAYKWYSQGMLPPAHIHARARRWAVKIFLSHLFEVWYKIERGTEPPVPFAIAQLGHAHRIEIPNEEMVGV